MALRINTNVSAITALRNLRAADDSQRSSLERLSTGLRINQASDDPSGLVISEQLRAQIVSMQKALENSQNASNMMATTEAALSEVSNLLVQIRDSIVFALNTGGNSPEQIDAEQDSIDNAIASIDRIASTTRFATRRLLDGSSRLGTASTVGSAIRDINMQNVAFDSNSTLSFTIDLTQVASRATLFTSGFASASTGTIIRVTGAQGTEDVTFGSGWVASNFDDAINAVTGDTGVFASGGVLYSTEFGSDQTISVQVVSGEVTFGGTAYTPSSSVQTDTGQDAGGYLNGVNVSADGWNLRIVSGPFTGDLTLHDSTTAASSLSFKVRKSGLVFQLNDGVSQADRERIGIRSTDSSYLGAPTRTVKGVGGASLTIGGYLSSLVSGGDNDLTANPENALRIVDAAINDISDLRAYLGAFQAQTVDTNINSLNVALENLQSSQSTIRDLDFAAETAEFTRSQILFQAGTAVLAQANLVSQSVLTLLG
ncbi:MAG: hypothetical protein JXP34_27995 [Planctomycetes bacterium]|nr:hypothetical protein [Planctomycetota bacterium]